MYGRRLKELRKERGWSIEVVAAKLEIGRSTYGGYETEVRNPSIEILKKMSALFDASVDYILGIQKEQNVQMLEYDVSRYLKKDDLNWDGIPLFDEDLGPVRAILERIVKARSTNT